MSEMPTDRELRLLKSGDLPVRREAELLIQIAQDPALQARFEAAMAFSAEERRAHIDGLLGRSPQTKVDPGTPEVSLRAAWGRAVERFRAAVGAFTPDPGLVPEFGWRGIDLKEGDREVPLMSEAVDFESRPTQVAVSALLRSDPAGPMPRVQLLVTVVSLDPEEVLEGVTVGLRCPLLTGGAAVTNGDGVAEFTIITGGRGFLDGPLSEDETVEVTLSRQG